ncbi:A-kinase-interacting protein 1 [Denticeps clupeoides]|uniref:A-kinase-interacting protein 1 n=1 Tax=Denticeps clupeoides TaxID=299321 RepID=A0AAY4D5V6_9TELE|nr:A-kinase-interacting protein 1 [Denticeps clupeoides]
MAGQTWLDATLQRTSRLGLEVLARARTRSVDWTGTGGAGAREELKVQLHPENKSLDAAFGRVAELVGRASGECENVCQSVPEPHRQERRHMCRYHTGGAPPRSTRRGSAPARGLSEDRSEQDDYRVEVAPGTYSVTAGVPTAARQTQVVQVGPGESARLTFRF